MDDDSDSEIESKPKKRKVKVIYESSSADESAQEEVEQVKKMKKSKKAIIKAAKSFINDEASCSTKDKDDEETDGYEEEIEDENQVVTKTIKPKK